jgi:hypothetical protein
MKGSKLYNGSKTAASSQKSIVVGRKSEGNQRNIRAMLAGQKMIEGS